MPSYAQSCPACQQGAQQGQANASYWQNQQQTNTLQSLQDSYMPHSPAPLGVGQGARGYNGTTGRADTSYIPVDPALTPGLTPDGYTQ
jgi:hypothetical protein